eukprot:3683266-Alexandrium_andersonii.AAC.1
MSASLVGSEMCIRDRRALSEGRSLETRPEVQQSEVAGRTQQPKRKNRPVSYTHLTLPTICSV